MLATGVTIDRERLARFCRHWGISELALFGSILRQDFRPESDVDVLVTFEPEARPGLFQLARMRDELEQMFGRQVDLVSRRGLESSRNPLRRKAILSSAEVMYAA